MSQTTKFLIITLFLILGAGIIFAQTIPNKDVQAEDLKIKEPTFLPDNPFYFLKNWAREIQAFFTFNSIKKAELRMKFANEKLMEVKKLVEEHKEPEIIKKATENYQKELEKMQRERERIREEAQNNPGVKSFLDKFIHQQTLHQILLQKLENQVSPEAFEKIKKAREKHQEMFDNIIINPEEEKPNEPSAELPNPASVYCKKQGYKLEIRTNPDGGQYGVCIFPDGIECEEWAFFKGECGVEYRTRETPGKEQKGKGECQLDKDCIHLICPQVIGMDTPRCDLSTNTCYCGAKEEIKLKIE